MGFDPESFLMGKSSGGGGGGGGGSTVDRTLQNSKINYAAYTKEGYVGGFNSRTSYWQPYNNSGTELDVDWSKPFALHLKFRLSSIVTSGSQSLFGCVWPGQYFYVPITCEIQSGTGSFWFGVSTNGSSWTNIENITFEEIPQSTVAKYTLDLVYDGGKVSIQLSNGISKIKKEIPLSAPLYHNSTYKIAFGNIAQSNILYSHYVYFDPDDCYIESNGVMVWGSKESGGGSKGGGVTIVFVK